MELEIHPGFGFSKSRIPLVELVAN